MQKEFMMNCTVNSTVWKLSEASIKQLECLVICIYWQVTWSAGTLEARAHFTSADKDCSDSSWFKWLNFISNYKFAFLLFEVVSTLTVQQSSPSSLQMDHSSRMCALAVGKWEGTSCWGLKRSVLQWGQKCCSHSAIHLDLFNYFYIITYIVLYINRK